MLGMYVHTHWGYHRPYSARRWTVEDWSHYLEGLSRLGFDTVKVWPQIDTMPLVPTASDRAYLHTLAQMTDIAHSRFGMKVILVLAPNCMGNPHAAKYDFASRPYFACEKKINPRDPAEKKAFHTQRRNTLNFVRNADAIAIIDSDPGGFIGSTDEEFIRLCVEQSHVFRNLNPKGEFVYWMWLGWETYNAFWKAQRDDPAADSNPWTYHNPEEFHAILAGLRSHLDEPWWLTCCLPQHEAAVDRLGLREKALFYPYGLIEGEPVFPLTLARGGMKNVLTPEALRNHPRGVMGNAQTHCLQVLHTYLFSHIARGGAESDADWVLFGNRLIPGLGGTLAEGWIALESRDSERQRAAAQQLRRAARRSYPLGDLAGLLFGDTERFLTDLAMQLDLQAALGEFGAAIEQERDARRRLRAVLEHFVPWQKRVGFADAYAGPLYLALNEPLKRLNDPNLNAVLKDFDDWRRPEIRNGIMPRLIEAMKQYAG